MVPKHVTNWWKFFTPITVSHFCVRCDIGLKTHDHHVCFLNFCHNVTLSFGVELGQFTLDLLRHVIHFAPTSSKPVTLSH